MGGMKHATLCLLLFLCAFPVPRVLAQSGIRAEASANIKKERHEAAVAHAKRLLLEKESLESQLSKVEDKLRKLDAGEDVAEESVGDNEYRDPTTWNVGSATLCCYATSGSITVGSR